MASTRASLNNAYKKYQKYKESEISSVDDAYSSYKDTHTYSFSTGDSNYREATEKKARQQAIELAKNNGKVNAGNDATTENTKPVNTKATGINIMSKVGGADTSMPNIDSDTFKSGIDSIKSNLRNAYMKATGQETETNEEYLKKQQAKVDSYSDDIKDLASEYLELRKEKETLTKTSTMGGSFGTIASSPKEMERYNTKLEEVKGKLNQAGITDDAEIEDLVDAISWVNNANRREETRKELKEATNTGNAGKTLANQAGLTALDVVSSGFSSFAGAAEIGLNYLQGKRTDTNSDNFYLFNTMNDYEAVNQENNSEYWEKKTGKEDSWQETLANFTYSAGMATAKSLVGAVEGNMVTSGMGLTGKAATAVGNAIVLPQFGSQAFVSTYQEMKDRGISDENALKTAFVSGLAEMGTEVFSLDKLWDVYKNSGSEFAKKAIVNAIATAGIEGSEEAASDVINELADIMINGNLSDYATNVEEYMAQGMSREEAEAQATKDFWKNTGYDFLLGSASGGMSGLVATGAGVHNNLRTGKYANNNTEATVNAISDDRADFNTQEEYERAQQATLDTIDAENKKLSLKDRYKLGKSVNEALVSQYEASGKIKNKEQLIDRIKDADVESLANIREATESTGDKEVAQAIAVRKAALRAEGYTDEDFNNVVTANQAFNKGKYGQEVDTEKLSDKAKEAYELGKIERTKNIGSDLTKIDTTKARVNNKTVDIKGVSIENGESYIETSEGKLKADEVTFTDKGSDVYTNDRVGILSYENEDLANLAVEAQQSSAHGINAANLKMALTTFDTLGRTGVSFSDALSGYGYMEKVVGRNILQKAFNLHANESQSFDEGKAIVKSAKRGKGLITDSKSENYDSQFVNIERKNGHFEKAEGINEEAKEAFEALPEYQKRFLEAFAKKTGIGYEFFTGNLNKGDLKGQYVPEEGIMRLNLNNPNIFQTALHEGVGEFLQAHNKKGYEKISTMLLNYWAKNNSDELAKRIRKYQKAYGNKYRESANELVNDTLAEIFTNEKAMRDMAAWMATNESKANAKTIKQVITDYIQAIKDIIADIKNLKKQGLTYDSRLKFTDEECDKLMKAITTAMDEGIASRDRVAGENVIQSEEPISRQSKNITDEHIAEIEENKQAIFQNGILDSVTEDFAKDEQGHINKAIYEYLDSIRTVTNKRYGTIRLSHNGVKHTISKGLNQYNSKGFKTIKSVLEGGLLVDHEQNWKGRGYDTYIVAGLVEINNKECLQGVIIADKTSEKEDYLFDIQDVIVLDAEILKNSDVSNTRTVGSNNESVTVVNTSELVYKLIQIAQNVNREQISRNSISTDYEKYLPVAEKLAALYSDFDYYDYFDAAYQSSDIAIDMAMQLANGDYSILDNLDEIYDDLEEDGQKLADEIREELEADRAKNERKSISVDSEGRELSEGQKEYFKDSKIVDAEGRLKVVYHGTENEFNVFDPVKFGGKNGTQEGFGIYLSDDEEIFSMYGSEHGIKGYVNITKPALTSEKNLKLATVKSLIKATCQNEAEALMEDGYDSLEDALKDTWISNYADTYDMSFDKACNEVAEDIINSSKSDVDTIQEIMFGQGIRDFEEAYKFYDILYAKTGIDGFVTQWTDSKTNEKSEVIVAFWSEQVKRLDNLNPTESKDVRYSIEINDETFYVNIKEDQRFFDDLITKPLDDASRTTEENHAMMHAYRNYINDKFRNKEIAVEADSFIVTNAKDLSHYTDASRSQYDATVKEAKMRASSELDNLVSASYLVNFHPYEEVKDTHPECVNGISEYITFFKVGKQFYKGKINIKNLKDRRAFYDLTKISPIPNRNLAQHIEPLSKANRALQMEMLAHYPSIVKFTRASIEVDDRYEIKLGDASPYADSISEMYVISSIFSRAKNAVRSTNINDQAVWKLGQQIYKEYKVEGLDEDAFCWDVLQFFGYLQFNDDVNYDTMMNYLLNVADEVLSHSKNLDAMSVENEAAYKRIIGGHGAVRVTDAQKKELTYYYDTWKQARNELLKAGVKISDEGSLTDDGYYSELVSEIYNETGYRMDAEATDVTQLLEIIDASKALKARPISDMHGNNMDLALELSVNIIERYFNLAEANIEKSVVEGTEEGKKAISKYKKQLREQVNSYKKTVNEAYDKQVKVYEQQLKDLQRESESARRTAAKLSKDARVQSVETARRVAKSWQDKALELKDENIKKTAELKAQVAKESVTAFRDAESKKKSMENITKTSQRLVKMFENPTDKRHVPDIAKPAVAAMINAIDFIPKTRVKRLTGDGIKEAYSIHWIHDGKSYQHTFDHKPSTSEINEVKLRESGYSSKTAKAWVDQMRVVKDYLASLSNPDADSKQSNDAYKLSWTIEANALMSKLDDILKRNEKTNKMSDISSQDLKAISDIMSGIAASINKMNDTYANAQYKTGDALGNATLKELQKKKGLKKTVSDIEEKLRNFLNIQELEPISYFSELGDASKSIYDEFREGENTVIKRIKQSAEAAEDIKKRLDISNSEISQWSKKIHEVEITEGKVTLTTSQLMSLYALMKRDQARFHLMVGGFRVGQFSENGALRKTLHRRSDTFHLLNKDYNTLMNELNDKQKAAAIAFAEYLGTEVSSWGNNVSQQMYGYDKYTEDYYFPMHTDDTTNATTSTNSMVNDVSFRLLQNQGFTKATVEGASNPLVLDDFFTTFTDHIEGMAKYEGYVMPIADAMRWYNYQVKEIPQNEGSEYGVIRVGDSVKNELERTIGNKGRKYFEKLIADINNKPTTGGLEIQQSFIGRYKAQAVMANFRVVIQQPPAYIRAFNTIDSKYLMKALKTNPKGLAERAQEHSPIAYYKANMGYDTMLGKTLSEMILGTSEVNLKNVLNGSESFEAYKSKLNDVEARRQYISDLAGNAAGKADDFTWGYLYKATELAIQDTKPELEIESEEYFKEVNKLFDKIIDETQVVDTLLSKSDVMRNSDTGAKLATAFMAEPTKTYNMLHRAFISRDKSIIKSALYVYALNAIGAAVAQSIADAWRDDDDETSWFEKFLAAFLPSKSDYAVLGFDTGNLVDSLNPFNLLPLVKEASSVLAGFDSTRLDTAWLSEVADTITSIKKYAQGKATTYGLLYQASKAYAAITGVPISNAMREVSTAWNNMCDIFSMDAKLYKSKTAKESAEKAKEDARISEVFDAMDLTSIKTEMNNIYEESYNASINDGKDENKAISQAWSKVRDTLKTQFKRQLEEQGDSTTLRNRYKILLKSTKYKETGKDSYRVMTDKEIAEKIEDWSN